MSLRLLVSSDSLRVMKYGENDIGSNDGEGIGDNTIIMMMVIMTIMVMMIVVMKEVIMYVFRNALSPKAIEFFKHFVSIS